MSAPPEDVPMFTGFLRKQGGKHKTWKRRWFQLRIRDGTLNYSKTKEDAGERVLRTIDLGQAASIAEGTIQIGDVTERCIEVCAAVRTFIFVADTEDSHKAWLEALQESRKRAVTTKVGYLEKHRRRAGGWVRRWFVLKDRQLLSYNSAEIAAETAVPRLLSLELCSHAGVTEGDPERPYCFALHMPRRRLVLAADTEEERNEWLTVITFHPAFQGTTGRG